MNKKVILLIAHEGYQQIEYGVTREILASNNVTIITASDEAGKPQLRKIHRPVPLI